MDPEVFFIPGMGSPNTFISSNSLSISARKLFPDMGLELSYTSMFDLEEKGSLHGAGLEYGLFSNTNLLIEVTKIFDNEQQLKNNFDGEWMWGSSTISSPHIEPTEHLVYSFPCKFKPCNMVYDVKKKLPLFTKSKKSKSYQ